MTNKPHVSSTSHRLNLEVRDIVQSHAELKNTIQAVHNTMKAVKTRLKSTAVLRNLTELVYVLDNDTMWSSKVGLLKRFTEIREQLIQASEHEDADIFVNSTPSFARKATRFYEMLSEIDVVTRAMQTKGRTLVEYREDLDVLIEAVDSDNKNSASRLYGCKLGTEYISRNSRIKHSTLFEAGVAKIQSNRKHDLSEDELAAVQHVRVDSNEETREKGPNTNDRMALR